MKKLTLLCSALTLWVGTSLAQVQVRGYVKKDGTYVAPHVRTSPDATIYNNYSYPGNYNPNKGYAPSVSTRTYQSTTSGDYSGAAEMYARTSSYAPAYSERTYITDKNGNQTGIYVITTDSTSMAVKRNIYSVQGDVIVAQVTEYFDGDTWFYDPSGKLIKRVKPKKRN